MRVLRFALPIPIYVYSPRPEDPDLIGTFNFRGLEVTYRFHGEMAPFEVPPLPPTQRYVKSCDELRFEVRYDDEAELARLVADLDLAGLQRFLAALANRVLRAIRHFGHVAHVSELRIDPFNAERDIRGWTVEVQGSDGERRPLFSDDSRFASFLALFGSARPSGELAAYAWPDIVEAVCDAIEAGPEREFLVNAIEHVRLGNFRYGLLEAVICLEIVVSEYLNLALERRGLPKDRIKRLLTADVGLTARVAGLLDLTLDRPIQPTQVSLALNAINWRNQIVHKTGHLPRGLPQNTLREGILAVLHVATWVALERTKLQAAPEMAAVARQLVEEFGGGLGGLLPTLTHAGQHKVSMDIMYIVPSSLPDPGGMERIVLRAAELLKARDSAFDSSRHLYVRFLVLPDDVRARWMGGRLTLAA